MQSHEHNAGRHASVQSGQALAEALSGMAILLVFILCLEQTGRYQSLMAKLQSTSHYHALAETKMRPSGAQPKSAAPGASLKLDVNTRGPSVFSKIGIGSFENVEATVTVKPRIPLLRVTRNSYVIRSDSHASSELNMHRRIEGDSSLWLTVSGPSQQQFLNVALRYAAIDAPWRRPLPTTDWLHKWEHVVPVLERSVTK